MLCRITSSLITFNGGLANYRFKNLLWFIFYVRLRFFKAISYCEALRFGKLSFGSISPHLFRPPLNFSPGLFLPKPPSNTFDIVKHFTDSSLVHSFLSCFPPRDIFIGKWTSRKSSSPRFSRYAIVVAGELNLKPFSFIVDGTSLRRARAFSSQPGFCMSLFKSD